jgi:hypothetical protein
VGRLRDGVGAQRLGDARSFAVEHVAGRLRGHVSWSEARSAGREDKSRARGQLAERVRDLLALVGNDPSLDLVVLAPQQLDQDVAAPVLSRPGHDAVRHRQHGGLQVTGSFVFSTSTTSTMRICLSTAFAMS